MLNLFGIIGFVILIIVGTLIVMPKNERLAVSTKEQTIVERVSRDAKHLPVRIRIKKQKDSSGV